MSTHMLATTCCLHAVQWQDNCPAAVELSACHAARAVYYHARRCLTHALPSKLLVAAPQAHCGCSAVGPAWQWSARQTLTGAACPTTCASIMRARSRRQPASNGRCTRQACLTVAAGKLGGCWAGVQREKRGESPRAAIPVETLSHCVFISSYLPVLCRQRSILYGFLLYIATEATPLLSHYAPERNQIHSFISAGLLTCMTDLTCAICFWGMTLLITGLEQWEMGQANVRHRRDGQHKRR